jgi:hypothetical protein
MLFKVGMLKYFICNKNFILDNFGRVRVCVCMCVCVCVWTTRILRYVVGQSGSGVGKRITMTK